MTGNTFAEAAALARNLLSRVAQLEDTVLVDGQLPVAIDILTLARLVEQQYSREGLSYEVIKKPLF